MTGTTHASQPRSLKPSLPYVGLVIGAWASAAPYFLLGPDLNAAAKNEFADHVVPGALMILLSLAMLVRARNGTANAGASFPLIAGFGIVLAGIWMTATHLPLVRDARNDLVEGSVAAWHTIPGLVVLVLGVVWAVAFWADAAPPADE